MGRLAERLSANPIIGLDTSIFIYHLEAQPTYIPFTREIFTGIESGQMSAATSVITLMELTVHPWKMGRQDVARKYEALLAHFPNLRLFNIDRNVARRAAQLRAKFRIHPSDALQVATCLVHDASPFITKDSRLSQLQPVLHILILDDYVVHE
ncbi:MAG: PIN domain-containing protein [Anaerolineales bacterium]|nr:PIN domain-containing protein [Anaerolineales bacterium]